MIDREDICSHVWLVMALLVINWWHALFLDCLSCLLGNNLLMRLLRLMRYTWRTDHISSYHIIDLRIIHFHGIDIGLLLIVINQRYLLCLNRIHVLNRVEVTLTGSVASLANLMQIHMILVLLSLRNHSTLVLVLNIFDHVCVSKLKHFLVILRALWDYNTRTVSRVLLTKWSLRGNVILLLHFLNLFKIESTFKSVN